MRYFDHNATSPACAEALHAWTEAVSRFPGNPSSPHRLGARAARALDEARERVAAVLGARAEDVVWTSGATEANNAVLYDVATSGPGETWWSAVEHPCVVAAAKRWLPGRHRWIPVTPEGVLDLDWMTRCWDEGTRPALVGVMAANNETGVLQPWREALAWCRERGVRFHCDAAQWLGKLPGAGLGAADFLVGCAHKFGGVPGVGFLVCPAGTRPLLVGGPQEEGRRAGTENVAGAVACAAALEARERALREQGPTLRAVARDRFEATLRAAVPGIRFLGAGAPRLWNTSAFLMPVVDCRRRWVVRLDKLGFAVSTGSACASGQEKPSHVLAAMGVDGAGERMLRASGGWETEAGDWQALGQTLADVAREWGVSEAAPSGPPADRPPGTGP